MCGKQSRSGGFADMKAISAFSLFNVYIALWKLLDFDVRSKRLVTLWTQMGKARPDSGDFIH